MEGKRGGEEEEREKERKIEGGRRGEGQRDRESVLPT